MARINKYSAELLLIFALMVITVSMGIFLKTPNDDAYIFLVYVKNLLKGNGLTYNGMVVEGYTSPFWIVLLSLLGLTGVDLVYLGQALSLIFGLGAVVLTYLYGLRIGLNKWLAFIPAVLLALSGDMGVYALSGLETTCFVFFVLLSFYLAAESKTFFKSYIPALVLSMTSWVRPEGIFIAVIFYVAIFIKGRMAGNLRDLPYNNILKFFVVYAVTLLPLFIFRYIYYDGEFLPNTYYAKANAGLKNLPHGIDYLISNLSNFSYIVYIVIPVFLLFLRRNWRGLLLEILFVLCWVIYVVAIGGDNMVGGRVFMPVYPIIFILSVLSIKELLCRYSMFRRFDKRVIALTLVSGIGVATFFLYNYLHNSENLWHIPVMKRNAATWTLVGRYLKKNVPSDTLIAVGAAGMIPYYSELPTIDFFGINNYYIAHYGKKDFKIAFAHQAGDGDYVLSMKPDILILGRHAYSVSKREIYNSPIFHRDYRPFYISGVPQEFKIFASKEFLSELAGR